MYQGQPFPKQEREAVDVVIKYAVTKLGFEPEEIMMFAWSIGGYTASYAAMMYPNIKGVVCFFICFNKQGKIVFCISKVSFLSRNPWIRPRILLFLDDSILWYFLEYNGILRVIKSTSCI